jgi:hypothetical protein
MSTTQSSGPMTASEFTQRTMLTDLLEQKSLLIGVGITIAAVWLFLSRRPAREEEAARRLVRDWRRVDDIDDARDLIGSNVPAIIRPALLIILAELERQIQHGFRRLERTIQRL